MPVHPEGAVGVGRHGFIRRVRVHWFGTFPDFAACVCVGAEDHLVVLPVVVSLREEEHVGVRTGANPEGEAEVVGVLGPHVQRVVVVNCRRVHTDRVACKKE